MSEVKTTGAEDAADPQPGIAVVSSARAPRWSSSQISGYAAAYGFIVIFVAVFLLFSILPSTKNTFFALANFRSIILSQGILLTISIGMLIPLVAGYFDLSVSAIAGTSSIALSGAI